MSETTRQQPSTARLTEVADGVFAYVQPHGGWCVNNAALVVSRDGSALVDTAATEARARRLRAAILEVASTAPRILVNTHFHGDHTFGNFVFPEAVVVGHADARTEMAAAGLHLTGLWPDVEWGDLDLALPVITYRDRITLHVGDIRAELIHLGPAHTTNDTVVWLPEREVLITGDLVMSGVTPFVPMGSVSGTLAALDRMRALGARTIITGHGPPAGPEVFDVTANYLHWVRDLARAGIAAGLTPLQVARESDRTAFAHLLDSERLVPNLHRAFAEERGAAPGAALDIGAVFAEMVEFHGRLPACDA
ncbi:MBL fold metallo-hydrolase [Embleya sp. NBC_00896]|uniref:MBL fold metallo-hydrolase n=1 Tax=Embleya sp. NBC_00896 TaxID=2975961 RepID=UPI00386F94E9|nr:MBL fold metallo-hydrolase [Embleya sp. NBC_00896]